VKSRTSKVFPYVSTRLPLETTDSLSEARDDNELKREDCLGLSMDETMAELAKKEASESKVIVRWIASTQSGTVADDIVKGLLVLPSQTSEIWALRFDRGRNSGGNPY